MIEYAGYDVEFGTIDAASGVRLVVGWLESALNARYVVRTMSADGQVWFYRFDDGTGNMVQRRYQNGEMAS